MSPAHENGATFSHAASPPRGATTGTDFDALFPALKELKEEIMLMHNENMNKFHHLYASCEAIRQDIKALRDEQRHEFAALKLHCIQQCDLLRSKQLEILSAIPHPVAASPASQLQQQPQRQQYPPTPASEASASQPESVNTMLKRKGDMEDERIEAGNVFLPQTAVDDKLTIIGHWYDEGDYRTGYIVRIPKVCGYNQLVEKLCEKLGIDSRLHHLELAMYSNDKLPFVDIKDDEDVASLISVCGVTGRYPPALRLNARKKINMKRP